MEVTTLKDIATKLGISVATVSKALKDYPDVNKETKKKVIHMAHKLNYTPNQLAVNLRTKQTRTIGVIIPTTVHHFFSNVIDGIIAEAEKKGYLVIILQSNEKLSLEKLHVNLLIDKRVDGILMSLSNKTNEFVHLKKIISRAIPLVLFDKIEPSIKCSKVRIDDRKAAFDAVSHLIQKGHQKIAHFRGDLNPKISNDRFEGYKDALIANGISYDPSLVYICDNNTDFDDGYNNAKKLLKEHLDIDAIFAITDLVAIGIIKYFNEISVKIPDDIAVVGFSNWFMSSVVSPTLTTINQPAFKIGSKATEILLQEIECYQDNRVIEYREVILPTNLIKRESS
ncbi:LacI family DNA-binding transcriptional regulator [Aquimarina sp. 2201CG14-23]|uniref:LacI family DNA-binding transcriptional regulator n=1 Tax=Aquimarina mycalae TaxID=3040073 RepID=UPI00247826A0|nr:LacI family DNA-binding transcriptional regulator [Aquimarina sp. 2201CG14-23]MDH7445375.1 LacI family DNA-binding transcriptional regulator [Aquimarina sp. 2201CG14-23]